MDQIIPNLYIGSFVVANDIETLRDNGITDIVNVSGLNNIYPKKFTYLKIDIEDDESVQICTYFSKCNRFIHDALLKGHKVLVHCFAGLSRGPTIIIAYLIRKRKYSYSDAFQLMKSTRPRIDINAGFQTQLKNYDIQTS